MTGPQPRNHEIDFKSAAALTSRHRAQVTIQGARKAGDGDLGGMFTKEAVLKILEQPNARYLRFYYGRNESGGRELVLVASDVDGNDIETIALDTHLPCPPICTLTNSTLRG